ncbi:hypothetical protein OIHEL45_15479 [Sulfitobacter indolifex HEL-45]|uniref:Uncharacterized protein n=1 Tax=Sulfitobacter indolifex HEL-45 TaxID=391624 RepID=A0ABM9X4G9_9RHOB|nr:hypothetical protein OIHEL45_15479 [Sulfitobacter indolifex HEL-45]
MEIDRFFILYSPSELNSLIDEGGRAVTQYTAKDGENFHLFIG